MRVSGIFRPAHDRLEVDPHGVTVMTKSVRLAGMAMLAALGLGASANATTLTFEGLICDAGKYLREF
jgi:hypothetical protein